MDSNSSLTIRYLQQRERVSFLYDRFPPGMVITLIVASVAILLTGYELYLQMREIWVYAWVVGLVVIQIARYRLKVAFDLAITDANTDFGRWQRLFTAGVCVTAAWQGFGAILVMPYVSDSLQLILHVFLLAMGAGAMAFLATSMLVYGCYLLLMMMPVTIYLFSEGRPDGLVLGGMYLFMTLGYYIGFRRLNYMIGDSLTLRFENEALVGDLQRLLSRVAESNKELDRLATTDEMTGAANFRAFRVHLEKQYREHMLSRKKMALAVLNIDDFYEYNHYYGQDMGNRTITRIVHLLMSELAQSDALVARINGAEFAVIMPDATPQSARLALDTVTQKLQDMQIEHCRSNTSDVVTLSVGVYCALASEAVAPREMIQRAEQALRQARKKGAGRIELLDS